MTAGGKMLDAWCREVGISRRTAHRWRNLLSNGAPMLSVGGNIFGYHFITQEDDAKFWERAKAGEFAKEISAVVAAGQVNGQSPLVQSNEVAVPNRAKRRR